MSIEFSPVLDRNISGLVERTVSSQNSMDVPSMSSQCATNERRREANRRNALKSTGPRTTSGKQRSSRNALKHGLCASTAVPSCEDLPTFNMHVSELQRELQPASVLQKILFQQIAQLTWNLRRFPEAQAAMFQQELDKDSDAGTLTASELLARRFSDESSNGFALLGRYERANQAMLLLLLNQFRKLQKQTQSASSKPNADDRVPREVVPAITPVQMVQQEIAFERRKAERELHMPPRTPSDAHIDFALEAMDTQRKQSQAKREEIRDSKSPATNPPPNTAAPVTKRSQCESALASSSPPSLEFEAQSQVQTSKESS